MFHFLHILNEHNTSCNKTRLYNVSAIWNIAIFTHLLTYTVMHIFTIDVSTYFFFLIIYFI